MLKDNIKTALQSIRAARWRSLLTMLGVIIGVASVVTTISLGEGVKQQVIGQINQLGSDLIIIRSGAISRDADGNIEKLDLFSSLGASTLTSQDATIVQMHPDIKASVPIGLVGGMVSRPGQSLSQARIVATGEQLPEILNQEVEYGGFFTASDKNKKSVIIGTGVAEKLFNERVPVGKTLSIRGQDFIVQGVFAEFPSNPLSTGADFNLAVFIPYSTGQQLTNGTMQTYEILAKPHNASNMKATINSLDTALTSSHGGQKDFAILRQEETLAVANNILTLLTSFVAGVAAISLIVGGIGIMNIMLVSVTERTHEIGTRKSVGATNAQIWGQFLIEAAVLSAWGGIVGVAVSGAANLLLRIFTDLQPVITLGVVLIAVGVSIVIGVVFGIAPAIKAARKDPIEALRGW